MEEKLQSKAQQSSLFRVTPLISDGAVLQRNEPIKIWGSGEAGSKVSGALYKMDGTLLCEEVHTCVMENGKWSFDFKPLMAGGPYKMVLVLGEQKIEYSDIYIGDVWLLAGQSNMQLPMERVKYRYPKDYKEGTKALIRQFIVPIGWRFNGPAQELSGGKWLKADAKETKLFSAVGYFFAETLSEKYHVPVGIILTAVGGTPIQSWMSQEALVDFPEAIKDAKVCEEEGYIQGIQAADMQRMADWHMQLDAKDEGIKASWEKEEADGSWQSLNLSDEVVKPKIFKEPGAIWLRRYVEIPPDRAGKPVRLSLGTVSDADYTYVNGQLVGSISYQYPPREYEIEGLPAGKNLVVIRTIVEREDGGFTKGKKHQLIWEDGQTLDISKGWEYKRTATMPALAHQTFFERKPLGMYQAMIAPLHSFPIKGVCWYQGETNADEDDCIQTYPIYFEKMINDWRSKWHKKDLPFIYVQLPNYTLSDSKNWVAFRGMQRESANIPHAAMVVTMDCGEANDLHPTRKQPVGQRIAMAAYEIAYEEAGNWLSPLFTYAEEKSNQIILHFDHAQDGLAVSNGDIIKGFKVCFQDGSMQDEASGIRDMIQAEIREDTVVLSGLFENGSVPSDIFYAWSNNPQTANLCSKKGLPVSPFEWHRSVL